MATFAEAGGNFIDTADIYSSWAPGSRSGVSEEIIGRWMKAPGNRDCIVLATTARGSAARTSSAPSRTACAACRSRRSTSKQT